MKIIALVMAAALSVSAYADPDDFERMGDELYREVPFTTLENGRVTQYLYEDLTPIDKILTRSTLDALYDFVASTDPDSARLKPGCGPISVGDGGIAFACWIGGHACYVTVGYNADEGVYVDPPDCV